MTARDAVWLLATVLFVGGCLGLLMVWWRTRPAERVLHTLGGPLIIRGPADVLHQVRHVRLVPRPPYDWQRDGD